MTQTNSHADASMDQILSSIRSMIAEENHDIKESRINMVVDNDSSKVVAKKEAADTQDDVLELTEEAEEAQSATKKEDKKNLDTTKIKEKTQPEPGKKEETKDTVEPKAEQKEETQETLQPELAKPEAAQSQKVSATAEVDVALVSPEVQEMTRQLIQDTMQGIKKTATARHVSVDALGQKTLEQLVQDMMQPLLKEWLNNNLNDILKEVLTEQVEKILRP